MANATIQSSPIHRRAVLWMVVTTFFWGGSFVANKIAFREIPPLTFVSIRFLLATLVMGLFTIGRLKGINRTIIRKGVAVGIALGLTNLSFVLGVSGTSVTRAGFLNNLFVLIIPLFCYLIWRERISRATFTGIFLAVAGLWCLARGGAAGFTTGDLLSTVCAFFIAVHIIAVSRILRDEDVYLVSLVQFATVTAMGALCAIPFAAPLPPSIGPASIGAIIYCAVFPTVICFTLQNTWQRYTTPAQAGLIYTLDPIWSMLGGMILLGERLSSPEWLGCILIFIGVAAPLAIRRLAEQRRPRYELDENAP